MNIHEIYKRFQQHPSELNQFYEREFQKTPPVFYLSCDLRNSGHKISVVDTNLFPAGFNNLCKAFSKQAIGRFQQYLEHYYPKVRRILVFSEAHTRNKFYFENLFHLSEMLTDLNLEVRVATSSSDFLEDPSPLPLGEDRSLLLYRVIAQNGKATLKDGFTPDLIVSNNDFSSGPDELLAGVSQPIVPPMPLGWYRRRKSDHFRYYEEVAQIVAEILKIDPWYLSCITSVATQIQLSERSSVERLAKVAEEVLSKIRQKYEIYGISSVPYVFVKNNSGTYGMAVTYVTSGQEILNMNRKERNKMVSAKGGAKVTEYLIQEGIVTTDFYSGYPIEPVIYMAGAEPIGGFFRLNEERDEWSSLNTKGMAFSCLCLHKLDQPHEEPFLRCVEKQTLVQLSFEVAKIAALAAAREASHT